MRLGKVCITHSYVVDLDDETCIEAARDALYDDVMSAVKYQELNSYIKTVEAPEADASDVFQVEGIDNYMDGEENEDN